MELHPIWAAFPDIQLRLKEVAGCLGDVLKDSPALIRPDLELVLNPGKMLRPAFALMSSTAGDSPKDIARVAAAIEILHTATLIHDDVIDQSAARRSRPTLHTKVGMKRAVLAGDYLFARSLELASGAQNDLLVSIMNKAVSAVCLSEIEQDSEPGNYFIDRAAYFSRIRGKTAELFALSCRVGAVLGGADEKLSEEFYDVGLNFGLAFQIMDDVLDYRGSADRMGKPAGNDLKAGIPTLPLILALESGDTALERQCRSRNKYRLRGSIRKRVLKGGFDKAAAAIGEEHLEKCLDKLQSLKFQDRDLFTAVISSLKIRDL